MSSSVPCKERVGTFASNLYNILRRCLFSKKSQLDYPVWRLNALLEVAVALGPPLVDASDGVFVRTTVTLL
jgi:hypothetical protein